MFDKDFYPTDDAVIDIMGIDCKDKVVLEPSAGRGNIAMWLKKHGAKKVIVCEKNPDLAEIAKTKGKFLKHNFFDVTAEEISHVNLICMNPPFSQGVKHILYAWEIASPGCEIITLINQGNLENLCTKERIQLSKIIKDYGINSTLGNVFNDADRETDVEIGLIKLFKPNESSKEFDGFFMGEDPLEQQAAGIMPFNSVRDVVQRYIAAVKLFEEHEALAGKMTNLTSPFKVGNFSFSIGYDDEVTTKEDFKKKLQVKAWGYLFDTMNLRKYVTSGVMKDINKFVEQQQQYPFTMKNIYKMFEVIVGTRENTFNKAIVESIDNFTKYHEENRYGVEGWKTNEGHLLMPKFIVPYMADGLFSGGKGNFTTKHGTNHDKITDLAKVLCSLTAKNYDHMISLSTVVQYPNRLFAGEKYIGSYKSDEWEMGKMQSAIKEYYEKGIETRVETGRPIYGKWFPWGFFEVKAYKKGTMHFKFKDEKVWEVLNRKYAAIKGQVLPEKIRI